MSTMDETCDVVVVGSGSAGLSAALRAAAGGLSVVVLEKTEHLGGTSAMSGAGTWIPANAVGIAAGFPDTPADALTYLRATAPDEWQAREDDLWRAFTEAAPKMFDFLVAATPLDFELVPEPDPYAERPGGKRDGRMLSPRALSRRLLGPLARRLRGSTLPHLFTYGELVRHDPYHHPIRTALALLPTLARRILTGERGQGSALVIGLLRGCLDKGVRIETTARVRELLTDPDDGAVVGVRFEQGGVTRRLAARRGVVLASGGFEWNAALRERHFPGPLDRIGSPRGNEGDGQEMAAAVGAALDRMDQANIYPCVPTVYEGRPHGLPLTFQAERHAIVVDRTGRRFIAETDFNIGEALDRRDPTTGAPVHLPAWVIADARFLGRSLPFRWYARKDPAWLVRADSLAALAARIGVPADALAETVARFNRFCDEGRDLDFHRGESAFEAYKAHGPEGRLGRLDRPPFVALSLNRSILGTKGGARTDAAARVLRPDGSVVGGLFAAGLAMANPIGTRAVGAGTTIGPNLTWGFIAAETILKDNGPRGSA